MGFPDDSVVENSPAMQETHPGSIPGSGRSPGGGHEKPMNRGAWRAIAHSVEHNGSN